ncbi:small-conductance mechanosensitive channel [Mucilaginibacter sp. SG538B]|uniref:mechanosensitive ion channel family protein n=1 Tax=Mucilaginibacter sp. SG538B TaxID=2587021 RepID=UPI00159E007A|nr:mechanosensitive ion channel family protein [Mucilaginibacter sp. SG538B]NVM61737.1 small-conductance mechanosensitive channel [Mucilaginibacter sp. SG538B]
MPKIYSLLILFLFAAFTTQAQKLPEKNGEPVIINRDTLFKFYAPQGLFDPKERAGIVTQRIKALMSRIDFNPDSLTLKNDTSISVITYNGQMIMGVNNTDASYSELNRPQLAASYLSILKNKLGNVFESNSPKQLITNVLEAVAVIILLIVLIWIVNKGFRWIKLKIIRGWENRVKKLAEKGAPIAYASRLLPFISGLVNIARLFIILLLVYLALPVLFYIFPSSQPIATQLIGFVVNPLKSILLAIVRFIPNLLTITVIYLVTRYIVKLVKFIATEIANGAIALQGFYPEWAIPTYNIIRVLMYAFMFVVIFPYLPGSQSKVFQGVTVFIGVLFSLGSSSAIANMVSGIVLTYMRPFKIGDRIKVGEIMGDVIEKNLLVTRVRTIKNEDVTVPNATILSGATVNYTSSSKTLGLILNTSVTIGYDAPWETIHNLLISAAEATEGILANPKPFVLQTALNDFNVSYQINAYTDQPGKMAMIYSVLYQNIQDKFNEAGMEIMSPHFTAVRDGSHIQIPENYVADGYKKPGYKIEREES